MSLLSIVVPVFNEEQNIEPFMTRLVRVLSPLGHEYEVIFVDDGSSDGSADRIASFHTAHPEIRLLSLSRNFGQQVAITAGMEHARGDAVVVMDADLQHPPELIPQLVEKWREGYEVVQTVRTYQPGSLFKRGTSRLFYRLLNWFSATKVLPGAADYRLLDRRALDALLKMPERHRFVRGMAAWIGFKQASVSFQADARHSGRTTYSLGRLLRLAVDGITSFSTAPLHAAGWVGLALAAVGVVELLWDFAKWLRGAPVFGWRIVLGALVLVAGLQLIFVGVVGLYLGRVFEEVKRRPLYLVRRKEFFEP
jgi:dolichol-phosphate mannosyltransferase